MKLFRKSTVRVKGQAELIGALFALMTLLMLIVYVVANILPSTTWQQLQIQEARSFQHLQELEKEGIEAIWDPTSNVLVVRNNSTIPVKIVRIWVEENGNLKPVSISTVIEPGSEKKIGNEILGSTIPRRVETARGTIVDVETMELVQEEGQGSTLKFGTEYVASAMQVLDVASLASNPNIYIDKKLIEEPTADNIVEGKTGGMVRYLVGEKGQRKHANKHAQVHADKYVLVLEKVYENVCVEVKGVPGIFILGYAPGTNGKLYNVLLTGTEEGVEIYIRSCATGKVLDYVKLDTTRYVRIKILGLNVSMFEFQYNGIPSIATNNASQAIGYWYYHVPEDIEIHLKFNGTVKRLKVYRSYLVESGQESSYEPYLLTADVDGNGVPELIFVDEDISYGSRAGLGACALNDRAESKQALLDVSTRPFLFYLKGYPIDPEKHGGVMVSLRWYFHDNEAADEECVEESGLPILGFYLVDPGKDGKLGTQDDRIVSSSEYVYQYLTKFEDTYPPNKGYITFTVTLVVPDDVTADKLYVAIGFNDPYKYEWLGQDDVDITLAVELLGIVLLPKST